MAGPKHILVVLACLLGVAPATRGAAAGEAAVRVLGARAVSPEAAAAILRAHDFPHERALRVLQETYLERGLLFCAISVRVEADSSYTVLVEEGPPARVRRARVAGTASRPGAEVLRRLELEAGRAFDPRRLSSRLEELLAEYDAAGYPFAQVWVDSIGVDADSAAVDVSLYVVEGTPRDVHAVVVEGLKKTRADLAVKIAGVPPHTPYRASVLEDAYLRMIESGVFTEVAYPTVRMTPDGRGVEAVITVDEAARSHTFAAALGYASAGEGTDRVLSGVVQLELNNVGGSLKDFAALWTNDGSGRNETRVRYRDRLFLGHRLGIGVRLEQIGQDTLYTWQSAGLEVERGVGRAAGFLLGLSLGAFGDRNVFSEGDLLRSTRWRGRFGLTALRGNERRGSHARLEAAVTPAFKTNHYREGAAGEGDVRQTIYDASVQAVTPAFGAVHLSVDGRLEWMETGEPAVPLSEQFTLGGARTVRGYRENQFHGRRIAYARNELRLGRSAREGFYLFVDAGYVRQEFAQPDGSTRFDDTGLAGYGFGVRSTSRVGRIDLSFAVDDEFTLRQTKVHVVLEQNF
jgi:outer membrane protein assembly factor BamA